jgi:hypothetical protein
MGDVAILVRVSRKIFALGLSVVGVSLTGCQFGPSVLKVGNAQYSDAMRVATSEQLLVNLVRMRYRDVPLFLGVSNISTQFQFDQSGDISGSLVENVGGGRAKTPDSLGLSAGVAYSERPTITFTILGGQEFQRNMLKPISVAALSLLAESGWRVDRVLRLTVEEFNGLENAPRASGPTPSQAPDHRRFLEATDLINNLCNDRAIEFEFETRKRCISSPLPVSSIAGDDLVDAAKSGAEFKAVQDGQQMELTKEERVLVMRFGRQAADTREADRLRELLRLDPDQTCFELVEAEESEAGQLEPEQRLGELVVDSRSLMGVLYYLSNGVQAPPAHEKAGLVTRTVDAQGSPFNWSDVLTNLFAVYSSTRRPSNAAVSVRHRGYWFYIRDDDETSKSTFLLLNQIFALQAGGVEVTKPVLTLPIGG